MNRIGLNREWLFKQGQGVHGVEAGVDWQLVDLPHDASISLPRQSSAVGGGSNAYYPGCNCLYEKEIDIPEAWMGGHVLIEFEGIYMNAVVTLNRQLVGRQPYGYTSFHCDLTPWMKVGKNTLRVEANNGGLANTRWYSGSGMYRPASLLVGGAVRTGPWDVSIRTPDATASFSTAMVSTIARNSGTEPVEILVRSSILSGDEMLSVVESSVELPAGGFQEVMQQIRVTGSRLWSTAAPFLHTLRTELFREGDLLDKTETRFGFRTISVDAVNGFRLNGQPLKLKGGCVHHDCGLVGAAAYARAEERKVELLLASGYNAVRCAHNPPSVAFLDACDRLGVLVIDEAFDCFRHGKNPGDYSLNFEEWWERDLTAMVLRDRNHPSVVIWSTGNEIIERDGRSDGAVWARRLAEKVRALDPSRPVTNALCDLWEDAIPQDTPEAKMTRWEDATTAFTSPLDVVGYNYLLHRYERDAGKYPGRIICGTETFPKDAFDYWEATERLPHVIGDFVWTSMDYLGEAGIGHVKEKDTEPFLKPFPWHHANCGDIDICGNKRPQSYYRDCVWGISNAPYIAVHKPEDFAKTMTLSPWAWQDVASSWNWPGWEGKPCMVDVYGMDDEIVLTLEGREVGRKPCGKANQYLASFEVAYQPGVLEAIGLRGGVESSRSVLVTSGVPAAIRLSVDRECLDGGFGDLAYVRVEVLDGEGRLVPNAANRLLFAVHGAGSLLAVGNGDPASDESFAGPVRSVWHGKATAVVRANGEPGEILLTVSAEGLKPGSVCIVSK